MRTLLAAALLLAACGGSRMNGVVFANREDLEFCKAQLSVDERVVFKDCMRSLGYQVK